MSDQLTVRALIDRLQQLVAEQPAIADMPVDLDDCGRCGCGRLADLCAVDVGPESLVLGASPSEWVQCVCGHEVRDHRAPGGKCTQADCVCAGYEAR